MNLTNQISDQRSGNQLVQISAAAFGAKVSSKREAYRFLTHECGLYLPDFESATVYHYRDLCGLKRRRISQTEMRLITVPHFEGLRVEDMIAFAREAKNGEAMEAFPIVMREVEKLPRPYIANVIYTIVGEPFKDWVNDRVNQRHAKRLEEQDAIQMDPEIARIFEASNAISGKYYSS